jgi:hypothetical protein
MSPISPSADNDLQIHKVPSPSLPLPPTVSMAQYIETKTVTETDMTGKYILHFTEYPLHAGYTHAHTDQTVCWNVLQGAARLDRATFPTVYTCWNELYCRELDGGTFTTVFKFLIFISALFMTL